MVPEVAVAVAEVPKGASQRHSTRFSLHLSDRLRTLQTRLTTPLEQAVAEAVVAKAAKQETVVLEVKAEEVLSAFLRSTTV